MNACLVERYPGRGAIVFEVERVHVDGAAIGKIAATMVIDRCHGKAIENPVVDVGFRIIERRSTSLSSD